MTTFQEKIQQAAERNNFLVEKLQTCTGSPAELRQHEDYIRDLDAQIQGGYERCAKMKKMVSPVFEDHAKYRNSTFRRFAHRAYGRKEYFDMMAANEEKRYLDAVQAQKAAEDEVAYTQQLRAEAEIRKTQMMESAAEYKIYQDELDALYDSIFAGYTPEFPDEDQKEAECTLAQSNFEKMNQKLVNRRRIIHLLRECEKKLYDAKMSLHAAWAESRKYSVRYDLAAGEANSFAAAAKVKHLKNAITTDQTISTLEQQIMQAAPFTRSLALFSNFHFEWTNIAPNNSVAHLHYDDIHRAIMRINAATHRCKSAITDDLTAEKRIKADIMELERQLLKAKVDLQKVREAAFRQVLSGEKTLEPREIPSTSSDAGPSSLSLNTKEAPPPYEPPPYAP